MATIDAPASIVRIVIPPTTSRALVVTLPEPLASDVRTHYAEMVAFRAAHGYSPIEFDEWVADVLRDRVYGHGEPGPEAR